MTTVQIIIEEAAEPAPEFGAVLVVPVETAEGVEESSVSDPFDVGDYKHARQLRAFRDRAPRGYFWGLEDYEHARERFVWASTQEFRSLSEGDSVAPSFSFFSRYASRRVAAGTELEFTGFDVFAGDFEPMEAIAAVTWDGETHQRFSMREFAGFDFLDTGAVVSEREEPLERAPHIAGFVERCGSGVTALRHRATGVVVHQWNADAHSVLRTARHYGPFGFDVVTFA